MEAHRARMRQQGFRLIQVWVPDVRSAAFATEAARQSAVLRKVGQHSDDQAFVEAISAEWDE